MAVTLIDNFKYQGELFNFDRDAFKTKQEMNNFIHAPIGFETYCIEEDKKYKMKLNNENVKIWEEIKYVDEEDIYSKINKNQEDLQALYDKLYPFTFNGLNINPSAISAINIPAQGYSVTVSWSYTNGLPTSQFVKQSSGSYISVPVVSNKFSYTYTFNNVKTAELFLVKYNNTEASPRQLLLIYPKYSGSVITAPTTEADVVALSNKIELNSSKNYVYSEQVDNKKICYAYLSSLGVLTQVVDSSDYVISKVFGDLSNPAKVTVHGVLYNVYTSSSVFNTSANYKYIFS